MNKRTLAINISKHPIIKTLLEQRMATTSEVARLIIEELVHEQELGQNKYAGQVQQLTKLVTSNKFTNFSAKINKFLKTKPKGLDAFVANMGTMDPQQLLEVLGDTNEWFKDRKVQIEKEAKAGKLDYAAFLLQGEFKKWEAQYKEAYEAYNTATGASETGNPDQKSYNKFRAIVLVWQDMFKSAVTLIKAAQDAEGDPERQKLLAALLKAKDIKVFLAIYKKLAGEENQKAFETTRSAIQSLIGLKKDIKDQNKLINAANDVLEDWLKTKSYMEFEKEKLQIKTKMSNLSLGIELKPQKEQDKEFPAFLKKIRNKSMEEKYSLIYQAGNKFFNLPVLAKYPEIFKQAIASLARGKTSLQEATDPEQAKKGRAMVLSFLSYYQLTDKKVASKIRKNKPELDKNIKRILAGANVYDEFNKPLADEFRKFAKRMQERESLIKQLLETKDITEFINIYRKLAGEDFKDELKITIDVIRSLAGLKKKKPDLNPGDKNLENILRSNWMAKNGFMDLEDIADRIKAKIVELITGIESDEKEDKGQFEKLLLALNKAPSMNDKLEIVRVRFPQYMAPDNVKDLKELDAFKDLFMAVVKRKLSVDEAKTPQIQGGSKEARQFLIGYLAYYKLTDQQSYEKIKADDEKFKKELEKVMRAADRTESFNQPLADALRKFVDKLKEKPDETPDEPEEKPPAQKRLEENYIKDYEKNFRKFQSSFLQVPTLHEQSEVYRTFYDAVAIIAGIPIDKIVGEQIAAFSKTARPDLKEQEEADSKPELKGDPKFKELGKNVSTGAKVIERHANSILEILEGYKDYLNIKDKEGKTARAGGVEQGSKILFQKFGESDPKKILYKFVKLIVNDIDSTEKSINNMKEEIKKQFPGGKKEKQNESIILEQTNVNNLSTKEKIELVEKIYNETMASPNLGQELLDLITKVKTPDDKAADQKKKEEEPEGETVTEAPEKINPDPTGDDLTATDKEDRKAATGDELDSGYEVLAKQIFDKIKVIRPLFPTSQPFDSEHSFEYAYETFKKVLEGLASTVAKVQRYSFDQLTSSEALNAVLERIQAVRSVVKEIFGFGEKSKDAKNQASFSEEGEKSGKPFAEEDEEAPETDTGEPATNLAELKQKLDKTITNYEKYISIVFNLLTMPKEVVEQLDGTRGAQQMQFLDGHFEAISNSKRGIITGSMAGLKTSFSQSRSSIRRIERMFTEIINKEFDSNKFQNTDQIFDKLQADIIGFLKKTITAGTGPKPNEKAKVNEAMVSAGRVRDIGKNLSSAVASYYVFKVAAKAIEEQQVEELEIDKFEERIKEFIKNVEQSAIKIKNSYDALEGDEEKIRFYKMFFNMRVLGVTKIADEPGEDEEELPEEEEKIADEVAGALVPKVSTDGNIMPKFEDPNGNLNIKNSEVEDVIDQEIEDISPESKEDPEKFERIKDRIGQIVSQELEPESAGKPIDERLSDFLEENEVSVVKKFLDSLVQQGLISENTGLANVFKQFGDVKQIKRALRRLSPDERKTLSSIIGDSDKRNKLLNIMGTVKKADLEKSKPDGKSKDQKDIEKKAEDEVEEIKKENSKADPKEVIDQVSDKVVEDSDGQIEDTEAKEVAEKAFVSHTMGIKATRSNAYKELGISEDMLETMSILSDDEFSGFSNFSEDEQIAIAIFMTFVSPDYDETKLEEQELGVKKVFQAFLSNYMSKNLVPKMLKVMEDRGVLDVFKKIMGDKEKRSTLNRYAKALGTTVKNLEAPEKDVDIGGMFEPITLAALTKVKKENPNADKKELMQKTEEEVMDNPKVQKIINDEKATEEEVEKVTKQKMKNIFKLGTPTKDVEFGEYFSDQPPKD